jgi:hypothetical protein
MNFEEYCKIIDIINKYKKVIDEHKHNPAYGKDGVTAGFCAGLSLAIEDLEQLIEGGSQE